MGNKNKQNAQPSAGNEQVEQADNSMNVTEASLLNKQQELIELEDLSQKGTSIAQKEQALKAAKDAIAKKEAELNDKRVQLEEMELQAKNGFPKLFEEKFAAFKKQLEQREADCESKFKSLEEKKEELRQRESAVKEAEIQRDKGYTDAQAKLDDELFAKRKEFNDEMAEKRLMRLKELEDEIDIERSKRLQLLSAEMDEKRTDFDKQIAGKKGELEEKEKELKSREIEVANLEFEKEKAKRKQERFEEERDAIPERVKKIVEERKQSFDSALSEKDNEIARLRESIKTSNALISSFEELKNKLGDDDPATVLLKLKTYEEKIKTLREDLATRPTQEMQIEFDRLKGERANFEQKYSDLSERYVYLKKEAQDQSQLELRISELETEIESYKQRYKSIEDINKGLVDDLKRLQSAYEREEDREARIRDIETPYIQKELPRADDKVEELQWLDGISKSCIDYGLRFPRRILHAFHTALKTSEWSPITVLAGVSGTGKSELPRLYSHFGGINFLSLSVQPNWDSQESMLGFFNSIDNKFDAQPILRLLAQTQNLPIWLRNKLINGQYNDSELKLIKYILKDSSEEIVSRERMKQEKQYPGLGDVMSLILLDEMNLAHIELYFAEFLSKLELRRGRKGNDVPSLEVKLGAGIQHYDLPLGRNVLWAGTMNQDETTKSLSDKVLDRGIVINFPRPTTLERRLQLKPLGNPAPLLSRELWESWWCKKINFNDDQILPFKNFIEEMNTSLSKVGRALGHRVWQSIEYYMANYPDVREAQKTNDDEGLARAMKIAFEDQLVQKVMPKLRGIETRGKSKSECLEKIREQLNNGDYTIIEDFDLACQFGYGQFIWNSANYLKDDEAVSVQENAES